jgi:hypothetical protein
MVASACRSGSRALFAPCERVSRGSGCEILHKTSPRKGPELAACAITTRMHAPSPGVCPARRSSRTSMALRRLRLPSRRQCEFTYKSWTRCILLLKRKGYVLRQCSRSASSPIPARRNGPGSRRAHPAGRNETSCLLATMITGRPGTPNLPHRSAWRRRPPARARTSHYQRQVATER